MANSPSLDLLADIEQQLHARLLDIMSAFIEALVDQDGGSYGEVSMSREDRIASWLDFAQTGVLDTYEGICRATGAPWFDRDFRQFLEDVGQSALVRTA